MYDSHKTHGDTTSLWYYDVSSADDATLVGDGALQEAELSFDVVIIGAGMAGLSVAYQLCQVGRSVAVVDKGLIASGETGRTTAHLSSALDDHYSELERMHGEAGARLAAESHTAAIAAIERSVEREQIACDFTRLTGYLISAEARAPAAERELKRELNAARRAGLAVELVHEPHHEWAPGWSLRFANQAQFQPLAYMAGLARAIRQRGARIFTNTRVLELDTQQRTAASQVGRRQAAPSARCGRRDQHADPRPLRHAHQTGALPNLRVGIAPRAAARAGVALGYRRPLPLCALGRARPSAGGRRRRSQSGPGARTRRRLAAAGRLGTLTFSTGYRRVFTVVRSGARA